MDEARTVLPGVLHLQNHGSEAVQKYIDSICDRMDAENTPDHESLEAAIGAIIAAS